MKTMHRSALLSLVLGAFAHSASAQLVDVTPTLNGGGVWTTRALAGGYNQALEVTFSDARPVRAIEFRATLAAGETIQAEVWDGVAPNSKLATGALAHGQGTDRFYRSEIDFFPVAGHKYRIGFWSASGLGNYTVALQSSVTWPQTKDNLTINTYYHGSLGVDNYPTVTNTDAVQMHILQGLVNLSPSEDKFTSIATDDWSGNNAAPNSNVRVRGYTMSFGFADPITALEVQATLPTTAFVHAKIYDNALQTLLATGSNVYGDGTNRFYRSNLNFTPVLGHDYRVVFYCNGCAGTNDSTRRISHVNAANPLTDTHNSITLKNMWDNTLAANPDTSAADTFPTIASTWGPLMRFVRSVDITPTTGTLETNTRDFNEQRGYTVTTAADPRPISGIATRMVLAANAYAYAQIWNATTMTLLARGSTVWGTGADTFYTSKLAYQPAPSTNYAITFVVSNTTTKFIDNNGPTFPWTSSDYTMTGIVYNTAGESYPSLSASFAPYMEILRTWGPDAVAEARNTITPTTGTVYTNTFGYVSGQRGYLATFNKATSINAVLMNMNLGTGDTAYAQVWNAATMAVVATGNTVRGLGSDRFYRSDLSFTPIAGNDYVIAMVVSNSGTVFHGKDTPTVPYYSPGDIVVKGPRYATTAGAFPSTSTWQAPEMELVRGGTFDFGAETVSTTSAPQNVVIGNYGDWPLNIGVSSTTPSQFTENLATPTIAAGQSSTFQTNFAPTVAGLLTGSFSFNSDDASQLLTTVNLQGTGTKSLTLKDVATVVGGAEQTTHPFGNVLVGQNSTYQVYVVNTGSEKATGLTAAMTSNTFFTISSPLAATSLDPGDSTTLTVRFAPTGLLGVKPTDTLTVSRANAPASSTTMTVTGTEVAPALASTSKDFGSATVTGSGTTQSVTVTNSGAYPLNVTNLTSAGTHAGDFTVISPLPTVGTPWIIPANNSQTVSVKFKPLADSPSARTAKLQITSADNAVIASGSKAYMGDPPVADLINATSVTLTGTATAGHIQLLEGATIVDNLTHNFGNQLINTTPSYTLTVKNTGTAPINSLTATLSGTSFSITQPAVPIAAGGSSNMTVTFLPTGALGPKPNGTITFSSPDVYSVPPIPTATLAGTNIAAQVDAAGSAYNFGDVPMAAPSGSTQPALVKTVTLYGSTVTVSGSALSITGANAADFTFNPTPPADGTAAAGGSISVPIKFKPGAEGTRTATLVITGNYFRDASTGNYINPVNIALSGKGVAPHLKIKAADGVTVISSYDFGSKKINTSTTSSNIILDNTTGTQDITSLTAPKTGTDTALFTLVGVPSTIAKGGSATIQVVFAPTGSLGAKSATATFTSPDIASQTLALTGTNIGPQISAPAKTFATTKVGGAGVTDNVTVTSVALNGSSLSVSALGLMNQGADNALPGEFTVNTSAPLSPIAAGGFALVSITFAPKAKGVRTTTLLITSDAVLANSGLTNSPFKVQLTGTGSQGTLSAVASVPFGDVPVGGSGLKNILINNTGDASLTVSSWGTLAAPFKIESTPVSSTIAAGASATVQVSYKPTQAVMSTATLTVSSSDASNPSVSVALSGNGTISNLLGQGNDFGNVVINTTSPDATITLTNQGNAQVTNLTASSSTNQFVVTSQPPSTIGASSSGTLKVACKPTGVIGQKLADLVISYKDPNPQTLKLALTCNETAPQIAIPSTTDWMNVPTTGSGKKMTVTVSNPGDAPLSIKSCTIGGANSTEFTFVTSPGAPTLDAKGGAKDHLDIDIQFLPKMGGQRTALLSCTSDAVKPDGTSDSPATGTLTGTAQAPAISVTPAPLDCGSTNANTSKSCTVSISNTGDYDLTFKSFTFAGTNAAEFTSTQVVPQTLVSGGQALTMQIDFAPTVVGKRTATLTFVTDDPSNIMKTIDLSGKGTSPKVAISPPGLSFGAVAVGMSATLDLTVSNTGDGPLKLTDADFGGADSTQFSLTNDNLPQTIAPGGQLVLKVKYTPSSVGGASATLTLTSDDPKMPMLVVLCSGNGTSGNVAVAPSSIDWGGQMVGNTSATKTVTVTNNGQSGLMLLSADLSGANAIEFSKMTAGTWPLSLDPGKTEKIDLTVNPKLVGNLVATLNITTDAVSAPLVKVKLSALGVSKILAISPATLDFGSIKAPGGMSMEQVVTITNSGGDPITLADLKITGPGASSFKTSGLSGVIAASASKTVNVSFAPVSGGDFTATIEVANDKSVTLGTVALSGKGLSKVLSANPTTLDFGAINLKSNSAPQAVTLTNLGTISIKLMSQAVNDSNFVVSGLDTTNAIAAGATTTFSVGFMPLTAGLHTGTISITIAGGATPELTLTAMGTGVDSSGPMKDPNGGGNTGGGCSLAGHRGWSQVAGAALLGLALLGVARTRRRRQP